jgi:hypothetical protein
MLCIFVLTQICTAEIMGLGALEQGCVHKMTQTTGIEFVDSGLLLYLHRSATIHVCQPRAESGRLFSCLFVQQKGTYRVGEWNLVPARFGMQPGSL